MTYLPLFLTLAAQAVLTTQNEKKQNDDDDFRTEDGEKLPHPSVGTMLRIGIYRHDGGIDEQCAGQENVFLQAVTLGDFGLHSGDNIT